MSAACKGDESAEHGARETSTKGAVRRTAHWLRRLVFWACPILCLTLLTGALVLLGLSWLSAVAIVAGTSCLAIIAWGVWELRKEPNADANPVIQTHGKTIEWMVPFYDRLCRLIGLGIAFRARTLDLGALKSGERVLDVGCGTGVLARLAARRVGPSGRVIGIDPGPRMIAAAQKKAEREGSRAGFELGVAEALHFPDESFDAAFIIFVLHHLPHEVQQVALIEIERVLVPGGRLVAVDVEAPALGARRLLPAMFKRFMGANAFDASAPLSAAVERAGLSIERVERGGLSLSVSVVARRPQLAPIKSR